MTNTVKSRNTPTVPVPADGMRVVVLPIILASPDYESPIGQAPVLPFIVGRTRL